MKFRSEDERRRLAVGMKEGTNLVYLSLLMNGFFVKKGGRRSHS